MEVLSSSTLAMREILKPLQRTPDLCGTLLLSLGHCLSLLSTGIMGRVCLLVLSQGPRILARLDTFPPHRYRAPVFIATLTMAYQALADYVDLITFIRQSVEGASESPVVAFGGSYGGMLAAWIRTKYPHIVQV